MNSGKNKQKFKKLQDEELQKCDEMENKKEAYFLAAAKVQIAHGKVK